MPKTLTKREVLSLLCKIYDPSELVSPVVTPLKINARDLWKEKVGWDEEVDHKFRSRIGEVLKGFSGGNHFRINRWLGVTPSLQEYTRVSLHVFTDPSSRAHAAGAYIRVTDAEERSISLLRSADTLPQMKKQYLVLNCLVSYLELSF
ncbi:uncharacterized protein LOC122950106 [Acropora millepora]|uniref:uncharacterized protein LOC122950106 n=1 Tax=Acropora millepora TaxID=45264 RepID=UPI001CF2131D|nr:uncharacterized protein LOC122950106 [Acropora millepora]